MTNLIEKFLLTGFGILLLIIFITFFMPYFEKIHNFAEEDGEELNNIVSIIEKVDLGIQNIITHPEDRYERIISFSSNLNISIKDKLVRFDYLFNEKRYYKILEYPNDFRESYYNNMKENAYFLEIYQYNNLIFIKFLEINA